MSCQGIIIEATKVKTLNKPLTFIYEGENCSVNFFSMSAGNPLAPKLNCCLSP